VVGRCACYTAAPMGRPRRIFLCAALAIGALHLQISPPAAAAPRKPTRELVIGDEALGKLGDELGPQLDVIARRIERLVGWPKGSLGVRGFADPDAALAYVRKNKPTFAILPLRQYVQGRKALGFEVLAEAFPLELHNVEEPMFYGVALKATPIGEHIQMHPGVKLAIPGGQDRQWVRIMFDGTVDPETHFTFVPVKNDAEALDAVVSKRADMGVLYERFYKDVRPRTENDGDLKVVYAAPSAPPSPLVAVGKAAKSDDRKKLEPLAGGICDEEARTACTKLGLLWFVRFERVPPEKRKWYDYWAWKYEHYK
jgi:hypothetical protein